MNDTKITTYDITKLHLEIKKIIDDKCAYMLNKKPRYQEIADFDELIYKYIPKHKNDAYDEETNQKGYVDTEGWERA